MVGKSEVFKQHGKGVYLCSGVEVSFLPEFIDTFITSRHSISLPELEETVAGLSALPFIPDAAVILDEIAKTAFSDNSRDVREDTLKDIWGDMLKNIWIEAKSLELLSVILNWHRGHKTLALVNEQDRLGIARALRYAEEHFSEPLVLHALAKQAYMSKSKFTSVFKNHTGLSVAEHIRRLRMEKALNLIKNTSAPLSEIAAQIGYKKHSNFSKVFKERYGVTPGTLRKKE